MKTPGNRLSVLVPASPPADRDLGRLTMEGRTWSPGLLLRVRAVGISGESAWAGQCTQECAPSPQLPPRYPCYMYARIDEANERPSRYRAQVTMALEAERISSVVAASWLQSYRFRQPLRLLGVKTFASVVPS